MSDPSHQNNSQVDQTAIAMIEVRQGLSSIKESVGKLERAVQGDKDAGTLSLREAIKGITDDLNNEAEALNDRVRKLEQAAMQSTAYQTGMMTVIKWLGGSSLAALVGLIFALAKLFGGK